MPHKFLCRLILNLFSENVFSLLIFSGSSSELEKFHKITKVHVPKVDDESFTSFFKSVKERITGSSFEISDEVFQFLSAETHEL